MQRKREQANCRLTSLESVSCKIRLGRQWGQPPGPAANSPCGFVHLAAFTLSRPQSCSAWRVGGDFLATEIGNGRFQGRLYPIAFIDQIPLVNLLHLSKCFGIVPTHRSRVLELQP